MSNQRNYVHDIRKKIGNDPLILIGSNVIIQNNNDEFLLQKRNSNSWGLPGGLMEIGESLEQTAIREVKEETNLDIDKLKLVNTFSGKDYFFTLENKDQIYVVTSLYKAEQYSGIMIPDGTETKDLKFFSYKNLPVEIEDEYLYYIQFYMGLIHE